MITEKAQEKVRGWFTGRLPDAWQGGTTTVTVDREEIVVVLELADVEMSPETSPEELAETRVGRARAFREETREHRIQIAREAEHRFDRKVAWGVSIGEHRELFTHIAVPVMTRLRQPQRLVLDTLVDAGVARSRSEALAWCVRLVGKHSDEWLAELREAVSHVADVRDKGPTA